MTLEVRESSPLSQKPHRVDVGVEKGYSKGRRVGMSRGWERGRRVVWNNNCGEGKRVGPYSVLRDGNGCQMSGHLAMRPGPEKNQGGQTRVAKGITIIRRINQTKKPCYLQELSPEQVNWRTLVWWSFGQARCFYSSPELYIKPWVIPPHIHSSPPPPFIDSVRFRCSFRLSLTRNACLHHGPEFALLRTPLP